MLNLNIDNRRLNQRYILSGLMPGKIKIISSDSFLASRPIDVSVDGIGVLSNNFLREGDKLLMETKHHKFYLVVYHVRKDYAKSSMFRYGLIIDKSMHPLSSHQPIKQLTNQSLSKDKNVKENVKENVKDKHQDIPISQQKSVLSIDQINLVTLFEHTGCLYYEK